MNLLKLALETGRWDLAAYTIILAAANLTGSEDYRNDGKKNKKSAHKEKLPRK